MLIHDIEVLGGTGENRSVRVTMEKHNAHEWTHSVVMLTHKSSSLRIAAVILDAKKYNTVIVDIPPNESAKDFFVQIYCVGSDSKIVAHFTKVLGPAMQQENIDPKLNMPRLPDQLTRKHISEAHYLVQIPKTYEDRFFNFLFLREKCTEEKHLFLWGSGKTRFTIPFPLQPTKEYAVEVFFGGNLGQERFTLLYSAQLQFHAAMDKTRLALLLTKATAFCRENYAQHLSVPFLYRNKPNYYFYKIWHSKNTPGLMTRYMKNDGGDQASPINRAIQGLFFSACFKTDGRSIFPPLYSPFGDQRLHVTMRFFHNINFKLYFADFFCHSFNHHVTLVMTIAGSPADFFCMKNLIVLANNNNPFFYHNKYKACYFTSPKVDVDIFFTENIDIRDLVKSQDAWFTKCPSNNDSKSKSFIGRTKNIRCELCNLNASE